MQLGGDMDAQLAGIIVQGLLAIVMLSVVIVLVANKQGGKISFGKLSAEFGQQWWTFIVRLTDVQHRERHACETLHMRERKVVDDALAQWRIQVAHGLDEFMRTRKALYSYQLVNNTDWMLLQGAIDFCQIGLKRKIMADVETNGFERFVDLRAQSDYIIDKIEGCHQVVHNTVSIRYMRDEKDCLVPPSELFDWISQLRPLAEKTWHEMYVGLIATRVKAKESMKVEAEKLVLEAKRLGCPSDLAEHLRRVLTDDSGGV